jgi:hypothetical protein
MLIISERITLYEESENDVKYLFTLVATELFNPL